MDEPLKAARHITFITTDEESARYMAWAAEKLSNWDEVTVYATEPASKYFEPGKGHKPIKVEIISDDLNGLGSDYLRSDFVYTGLENSKFLSLHQRMKALDPPINHGALCLKLPRDEFTEQALDILKEANQGIFRYEQSKNTFEATHPGLPNDVLVDDHNEIFYNAMGWEFCRIVDSKKSDEFYNARRVVWRQDATRQGASRQGIYVAAAVIAVGIFFNFARATL